MFLRLLLRVWQRGDLGARTLLPSGSSFQSAAVWPRQSFANRPRVVFCQSPSEIEILTLIAHQPSSHVLDSSFPIQVLTRATVFTFMELYASIRILIYIYISILYIIYI